MFSHLGQDSVVEMIARHDHLRSLKKSVGKVPEIYFLLCVQRHNYPHILFSTHKAEL